MNDFDIRRKNAQEKIIELSEEAGTKIENLIEAMFFYCTKGEIGKILKNHNFKRIDIEDNYEYSGRYYVVFEIDGKFYRTYYKYQSHYGCDFENSYDEIYEVLPTTQTVIIYS